MGFDPGYDAVLQVEDPANPGSYLNIDGQTGASLNETTETVDTTHKKDAGVGGAPVKEETPISKNWELSVDGNCSLQDPGFKAIQTAVRNTSLLKFRLIEGKAATAGEFEYAVFTAYPGVSKDYPLNGTISYSISFSLQGEPTYSTGTL